MWVSQPLLARSGKGDTGHREVRADVLCRVAALNTGMVVGSTKDQPSLVGRWPESRWHPCSRRCSVR